jgi:Integrase zinc binding domain/RNase H-like domain found in reverse transcriptase
MHGSRFVIRTDHHPLRYLDTQTNLSKRKMRWMKTLQEYDYSIEYVQGKYNVVADALSRVAEIPTTLLYTGEEEEDGRDKVAVNVLGTVSRPMLTRAMIQELTIAYQNDEHTKESFNDPKDGVVEKTDDGLLYESDGGVRKLIVPQGKLRQALVHEAHDSVVSGHLGFNKAYERLRNAFSWPQMHSELKAYVRSCDSCQRNKSSNQKPIGLLQPFEVPEERFQHVSMDFITALPKTKNGFDAIMVIVDKLTKLVMFIPTTTEVDAVGAAKLFFGNWYRWYGLPSKIISDRDGRFVSKFWRELFRLMQTKLAMSTSHHTQTDGQTEKANRTLEEMGRHYVNYQQNNWDELLPGIEHAYNSSVHAATGESPFVLTYGKAPQTLTDLMIRPSETAVESVTEFISRMQGMAKKAREFIEKANASAEKNSNKFRRDHQLGVGD